MNCNFNRIPMMVDMAKYGEVFGVTIASSRRSDYTHDYERMDLTPDEIKDFIDKGIDMKTLNMEKEPTQEETLKLALDIASKTVGFDVKPMAFEDIPKHLEEFLTKALGKKVNVEGSNPFVDGITVTVEKEPSNETN